MVAALALKSLLVPALAFPASVASTSKRNSTVKWTRCPAEALLTRVECGTISVPLDHEMPHIGSIEIAVTRLKSTGYKSKGSLHFNPGGPGGPGSDYIFGAAAVPKVFGDGTPELLENYDFVGVDPRGVGLSPLVKCGPDLWNKRVTTAATDKKSFDALIEWNKDVGDSCVQLTGPLINHLDTVNVIKDFELVRQALGDEKFNFVGISYGTQIGYTYAEHYPDKVGRMVIDGIVDHSQSFVSSIVAESLTYSATLEQFFRWCKENSTCAFHAEVDHKSFFESIVHKAEAALIPAPGCQSTGPNACFSNVTAEELLYNIQDKLINVNQALHSSNDWAVLSEALVEASKGNATFLSTQLATSDDSSLYSTLAIGCQDWAHPSKSSEDIAALFRTTTSLTPLTKGFTQGFTYNTRCIEWPAPLTNPQRKIHSTIAKAPPILMMQSLWDPETSIQWAEGTKAQIPKAHMIFRNGSGHSSFMLGGETSKASMKFLIEGTLPADGTVYDS